MAIKQISGFITGKLRSLFSTSQYFIKSGYRHRSTYIQYDDRMATDESQKEVYQEVVWLMKDNGLKSVVDYGCGSGYKLVNYFKEFETKGVEVSPTYEFLVEKYPNNQWYQSEVAEPAMLTADVLICADVIEHVMDPDAFLRGILQIPGIQYYVISTPDRDSIRGKLDYGPPFNKHHIREWNLFEFRRYMNQFFNVESHKLVNIQQSNQLIIGTRKRN